jgi:hypothetical protein
LPVFPKRLISVVILGWRWRRNRLAAIFFDGLRKRHTSLFFDGRDYFRRRDYLFRRDAGKRIVIKGGLGHCGAGSYGVH